MSRYETILSQMIQDFEAEAGCLVDDASDTGIQFKILAEEFARISDKLDHYALQIFPNTAEGEFLKKHGMIRGFFPKEAVPAQGKVIFRCGETRQTPLVIPAGTLCTSSKGSGLMYRTTQEGTIPKGSAYCMVPVEAAEAGSHTNLAPGRLDILVTPVAGIVSVENIERIDGGADPESDESFRRRVVEGYHQISNGANLAYYEQFAKSRGDIWYAKAAFSEDPPQKLTLYVENFTRSLADSTVAALQEEVEQVRELGIPVTVKRPAIKGIQAEAVIRVNNLANSSASCLAADKAIRQATQELSIGERWSPVAIGRQVLDLPGVLDIRFSAPAGVVTPGYGEICAITSLLVTAEK